MASPRGSPFVSDLALTRLVTRRLMMLAIVMDVLLVVVTIFIAPIILVVVVIIINGWTLMVLPFIGLRFFSLLSLLIMLVFFVFMFPLRLPVMVMMISAAGIRGR